MTNSNWSLTLTIDILFTAPSSWGQSMQTAFLKYPFTLIGRGGYSIDWGDGTVEEGEMQEGEACVPTHLYKGGGLYSVRITGVGSELLQFDCRNAFSSLTALKLEGCHQLRRLDCSQDDTLEELEIGECPELEELLCTLTGAEGLKPSRYPKLRILYCGYTYQQELDLTENPLLEELFCYGNYMNTLDLSHNPQLRRVVCWGSRLTRLKLGRHPALTYLNCGYNKLTELDLSGCPELEVLKCSNNQLTELDLSGCPKLAEVECDENPFSEPHPSAHNNG